VCDQVMETTQLVSLFSLFWKNLEAHCFRCFGRIWKLTGLISLFSDCHFVVVFALNPGIVNPKASNLKFSALHPRP
jgi:hypothetical protein